MSRRQFNFDNLLEMADLCKKKWNHERKKLLIDVRLRHEPDFTAKKKKRNTIWKQTRCLIKIMGTYKRIKKRNITSGERSKNWEFFKTLDEVFGSRCSVQVPIEMIECTLQTLIDDLGDGPLTPDNSAGSSTDISYIDTSTPRSTCKRKRGDILGFLDKESEADAKVMKKLLDMEEEKLAVEKEKLTEMKEIRSLLQRITENS